ncbi:MAG: GNAT family N-acetyltransferase [Lentihominibacter sp.]|jgi:GNAT superfamily N-acetyltransferase
MIEYRSCEKSDCEVWILLNREFMAEEIQDEELWHGADQVSDEQFQDTFHAGLKASQQVGFLLFEEDDIPVGFANLMIVFSVWTHGPALVIDDLYLRPDYRGKGYGRSAMEMIEEYAKERGCKRIQFQSELTNPNAMEFYRVIGYQPADMKFYVKYI